MKKNKEVVETVFEKCPVCKKGKVQFVNEKYWVVFTKQSTICNKCGAKFNYEGEQHEEDVYILDLSECSKKNKYDGVALRRSEWERGNSDVDECVRTNTLPKATVKGLKLILQSGEQPHWYSEADLMQERAIRHSYGGAVRVAKGVYIGGKRGESHGELRRIDSGELLLTNERLIFNGDLRHNEYKLNKVVAIEEYDDAFELGVSNRKKVQVFVVDEPHKWVSYVRIAVKNFGKNKKKIVRKKKSASKKRRK